MKKMLQIPLLLVALFLTSIPISAHEFEVDGIYYERLNRTYNVAVTYKGDYYYSYSNEYIGTVTIPSSVTYNGTTYSVTEIDVNAFQGCTGLTSVTIPNSVTSIGGRAFYGCTGLLSFSIPNSITKIESGAFHGTGWYNNQPNGILYLDNCCLGYKGYKPIGTLSLKNGTRLIADNAFYGCNGLTSVTIPNSVTEIGDNAFYYCTGLTSVTIGNSVTEIGYEAFYNCTSLTSVTIPNSVTEIGDQAFEGCTGLTSIVVESGNTIYDSRDNSNAIIETFTNTLIAGCKNTIIPNSVTTIGEMAFYKCSELTSITIPNSETSIGNNAFYGTGWYNNQPDGILYLGDCCLGCKGYNKPTGALSLKNGTRLIGDEAFYRCYGLTSITIPNSVTSIGNEAFYECSELTSITIPNSVTSIGNEAFYGTGWYNNQPDGILYLDNCCLDCKGYTPTGTLSLKNGTRLIGDKAFYKCSGLISVAIPNTVTSIGYRAFEECYGLAPRPTFTVNQFSATLTNLSTPTQYTPYFYCNGRYYYPTNKITGLRPGSKYYYDYGLIINGIYCQIDYVYFTTSQFNVNLSGSATASSVSATGSYTQGEATLVGEGLNLGSEVTNFDNKNNVTFEHLDPNTSYTVYYGVKIKESTLTFKASRVFKTEALNWANGRYDATSTTSARLIVETNCDATLGTGYEWRRIDAPDIIASSKVECPVVNGMLVGSLRNLNPDVYYKCRPYYTSASGNTYYGDWVGFYTADANVYFSPEVLTYSNVAVNNNSAVVKGYALEGTDVITAQGFEYWKTGTTIKPASTDDRKVVNASGIAMSATLTNLDYNSTYKYRAFVTTEKGTVYGDEIEFSTGDDPAGIGYIEIDSDELTVTLRENPATGTAWVKIAGATGGEAQYAITSMSGSMVACGRVMLEDEWNAIELDCPSGLYLLTVNDGKQVKTLRLIVK